MTPCKHVLRGCRNKPPHMSVHHKWWPARDYRTALERAFREHPANKVLLCRCLHDLEHLKRPPQKPSAAFMRRFLKEN